LGVEIKVINNRNQYKAEHLSSKFLVILNIHVRDGPFILELTRIVPCLINNVIVISEYSTDNQLDEMHEPYVDFINPNDMKAAASKYKKIAANPEKAHKDQIAKCAHYKEHMRFEINEYMYTDLDELD
jgi:hypothetical protein